MASPAPDALLQRIADYVVDTEITSEAAYRTAAYCLADALGCGLLALRYPACTKLLGPIVPGTVVPDGVPTPGTPHRLDPVKAAFDIGAAVRWLDYNDTWLAAEWGHPSDNFGAILAAAWYAGGPGGTGAAPSMRDVLTAAIKAYEIQGVLSLDNAFNRFGLDHVLLVRVASTAVATGLLGGSRQQVVDAVSNAWLDGGALRAYRQAPNAGSRKSWAAGDATSRGVRLALMVLAGEMGYPQALSAPTWGFEAALLDGKPVTAPRPFGSYVVENVLFKVPDPTEFHAQTALEAAIRLHPDVAGRVEEVERVEVSTQESAVRIISKTGPLRNPADRDHCLQYIVAVGLLHGRLSADSYEDAAAADPRIDALRDTMTVTEDPQLTADYLDPDKRSIGNAVQVRFRDGTSTGRVRIDYPLGHRVRREEGLPLVEEKLRRNLATRFAPGRAASIAATLLDHEALCRTSVRELLTTLAG